ncbi:MAG: hypothetical protein WBC78_13710 [Candidatus Sulfotelmatobacter sp.]
MQIAMTLIAVVAGMVFSLAVALLAEELIFGQVIRLFFVRTDAVQTSGTGKTQAEGLKHKGERRCSH